MKKLLTFAIAILALAAGSALAGDYHTGATLYCNECHVMHGQQSHAYDSINGTAGAIVGAPHEYLLRQTANDLCMSCHNGQTFAPDVVMADVNTTANGRLAGALNEEGVVDATYAHEDGHTIGSMDTPPGNADSVYAVSSEGLRCIDCHTQHGRSGTSNVYRNLITSGTDATTKSMTYNIGSVDLTKWVYERVDPVATGTKASFDQHYSTTNVDYVEVDQTKSAYATYCKRCHTNFHGTLGGAEIGGVQVGGIWEEFERHPAAGVNLGAAGGGHSDSTVYRGYAEANRVKVMSPTGDWGQTTIAGGTPSCFSCHKSHGSSHSFGLIYPRDPKATGYVAAPINEDGDGTTYYGLCRQCHKQ